MLVCKSDFIRRDLVPVKGEVSVLGRATFHPGIKRTHQTGERSTARISLRIFLAARSSKSAGLQ